jgi:hypothetical protein
VADIAILDDGLGTNTLSLSGADATSFQLVGTALHLKAGTVLNAVTKPTYVVVVSAVDATLPGSLPASTTYTLTLLPSGIVVDPGTTVTDPDTHTGTSELRKRGTGTLILDKANSHSGGTVIEAGEVIVRNAAALGTGTVRIMPGARLLIDPGAGEVVAGGLAIDDGGRVDLDTARMTVTGGMSVTSLLDLITAARGDGSWTHSGGLGSTAVAEAVAQGQLRSIGWLDNGDGSFTVAFAAPGDSNLDGAVDVIDAANLFASGKFETALATSWSDGDSNYDGIFDILDVSDLVSSALYDGGTYVTSTASLLPDTPALSLNAANRQDATNSAFASLASESLSSAPSTARKRVFSTFR